MSRLRDNERKVLELLGEAVSEFSQLPPEHPADQQEFVLAIHAAQNIVLARVGSRSYKKISGYDAMEQHNERTNAIGFRLPEDDDA